MPACTKNINIHLWEPINGKFYRAVLAEFIAMFFFVLMCCGCAMVTLNDELDVNQNLMQVAASFGFGIMVIAQLVGPLSGGHINCAVSFALFIGGRISGIRLVCYTLSQMAGSVFGALFLWAIFGSHWQGGARAFGSNSWDENTFDAGKVFLAEAFGTALLVFTVFATIDIPMQGAGPLGVFPIAMSVMVAHLFLLPIDGCSINPTRSFGPSLVAAMSNIPGTYQNQQYMFWLGPLFGAALAAFIYEYGSLKPLKREGAHDLDEAVFLADVGRKDKPNKGFAHEEGNRGDHMKLTSLAAQDED